MYTNLWSIKLGEIEAIAKKVLQTYTIALPSFAFAYSSCARIRSHGQRIHVERTPAKFHRKSQIFNRNEIRKIEKQKKKKKEIGDFYEKNV